MNPGTPGSLPGEERQNLIRVGRRWIQVKDEDVDWLVYHQLPESSAITVDGLTGRCGIERAIVEASLARLERSCLVEQTCNSVRQLSFGEALIRNQMKYEEDLPFTIENGVVRAKKRTP